MNNRKLVVIIMIIVAILIIALVGAIIYIVAKENKNSNNTVVVNNNKTENKMTVTELTQEDFVKKVYDFETNPNAWKFEGDKPAVIDFYATWCGPCKMMSPILDEISKEYEGKINVYKVNVDKEADLASVFGIRSIPSLLFVPMKKEPSMVQGAMPRNELKKLVDDILLESK